MAFKSSLFDCKFPLVSKTGLKIAEFNESCLKTGPFLRKQPKNDEKVGFVKIFCGFMQFCEFY